MAVEKRLIAVAGVLMKRVFGAGLVAVLLAGAFATAQAQTFAAAPNLAEQYLQEAADQERAERNLPPLRRDLALVAAARQHALEMVQHNTISHQFAQEPDLAARGAAAGAKFSLISENVAESPSAVKIHTAWMNSEGHRHNLLDPNVDSVGIAVIARGHQLFAVEDFERRLTPLSLKQQEGAVASALAPLGIGVAESDASARKTCAQDTGSAGPRQAEFVMRYTTANLSLLPEQLRSRVATGKYVTAIVGACPAEESSNFSMYRIAVLLYRQRNTY